MTFWSRFHWKWLMEFDFEHAVLEKSRPTGWDWMSKEAPHLNRNWIARWKQMEISSHVPLRIVLHAMECRSPLLSPSHKRPTLQFHRQKRTKCADSRSQVNGKRAWEGSMNGFPNESGISNVWTIHSQCFFADGRQCFGHFHIDFDGRAFSHHWPHLTTI